MGSDKFSRIYIDNLSGPWDSDWAHPSMMVDLASVTWSNILAIHIVCDLVHVWFSYFGEIITYLLASWKSFWNMGDCFWEIKLSQTCLFSKSKTCFGSFSGRESCFKEKKLMVKTCSKKVYENTLMDATVSVPKIACNFNKLPSISICMSEFDCICNLLAWLCFIL